MYDTSPADPPSTDPVDTDPPATDPSEPDDTDAATQSPTTDAPATGSGYDDPCELLVGVDLDALLAEPVGEPVGELDDIADRDGPSSNAAGPSIRGGWKLRAEWTGPERG